MVGARVRVWGNDVLEGQKANAFISNHFLHNKVIRKHVPSIPQLKVSCTLPPGEGAAAASLNFLVLEAPVPSYPGGRAGSPSSPFRGGRLTPYLRPESPKLCFFAFTFLISVQIWVRPTPPSYPVEGGLTSPLFPASPNVQPSPATTPPGVLRLRYGPITLGHIWRPYLR